MNNPIVKFFVKLWKSVVVTWSNFGQLRDLKTDGSPVAIPEPEPSVNVGDTAINPSKDWLIVQNPNGRRNGNSFYDFGATALVHEGGIFTVVVVQFNRVLVSYQSPNGQGYGSEAGNGTLFFISKKRFVHMTKQYREKMANRETERLAVLSLLRQTKAAAKVSIPYSCSWNRGTGLTEWCEESPSHVFFRKAGDAEEVFGILCTDHANQSEIHLKDRGLQYRMVPLNDDSFPAVTIRMPGISGRETMYVGSVSHDLKVYDRVIDLTARANHWLDDTGVVCQVDGSHVEVRYLSGAKHWKMHVNLIKATAAIDAEAEMFAKRASV